jgi:hypothetical protein
MNPLQSTEALEDRLRDALNQLGDTYEERVEPSVGACAPTALAPVTSRTRPRKLVGVGVAAFVAVLVIVLAVSLNGLSHSSDTSPSAPHHASGGLFPDVPDHHGRDLYLTPNDLPQGFHLVSVLAGTGEIGGGGSTAYLQHVQYWVRLSADGTPLNAVTLGWGPNNPVETQPHTGATSNPFGAAIEQYQSSGVPITVANHLAYYDQNVGAIAWVDGTDIVVIQSGGNLAQLEQLALEQIASSVQRTTSGYALTPPPTDYQFVGEGPAFASLGRNGRFLTYGTTQGNVISLALANNSELPVGSQLLNRASRLTSVRGHSAVITPTLTSSTCPPRFPDLCAGVPSRQRVIVQWVEPDNTTVTLTTLGLNENEALRMARHLQPSTLTRWKHLGNECPKSTTPLGGFSTLAVECQT